VSTRDQNPDGQRDARRGVLGGSMLGLNGRMTRIVARTQQRSPPSATDGGLRYVELWVLPAGHQDQCDCCGCNREQRDHAGGLSPTGSGRSPDFSN
jgi:hypothetical protein